MELLYVWIKKYKNIEEQGFNFSPKWWFHYDLETSKLDVEDRSDRVIDGFFGEHISNVTAIVGENGSGKSNLLQEIGIGITNHSYNQPRLFVLKKNNELIILTSKNIEIGGSQSMKISVVKNGRNFDFETLLFYHSNNVDLRINSQSKGGKAQFFDISTNSQLYNFQKSIVDFLKFREQTGWKTFTCQPDALKAFLQFENAIQLSLFVALPRKIEALRFLTEDVVIYGYGGPMGISDALINEISDNLLKYYLVSIIIQISKNLSNHLDINISFINEAQTFDELILKFKEQITESHKKSLAFFEKIQDYTNKGIITIPAAPKGVGIINLQKNNANFKSLFRLYAETVFTTSGGYVDYPDYYLGMHWGDVFHYHYSTGEKFVFSLLSRLWYQGNNYFKTNSNIILLVDEFDAGLHPAWQRSFLTTIVSFIPKLFPGKTLQIILTTHSPFILSDLPKENVIFLKKGESGKCQVADGLNDMKQTFGANIHTLLSDGFFMDGLMGDFAKGKIDKVIRYLNRELNPGETMTEDEAVKIIDMIGEPILKRHLQQQIQYRKNDKRDEQIAELRQRIEKLENEKNPKP